MIEQDLNTEWDRLTALTRDLLIRRLNDQELCVQYITLLNAVRHDRVIGKHHLLGLRRAPASKDRHHSVEGGLVQHLLQMFALWQRIAPVITSFVPLPSEHFNDSVMWRAILHHDLNKVWRYDLKSAAPWIVEYSNIDTLAELLGSTNKSLFLLQQYGIPLTPELYNALLCAEGGFSRVRPRLETVLAKVLYLLDELSANVVDRLQHGRFMDSKAGGLDQHATR